MSLTDRLDAYFRARPNVWLDGLELAKVAGSYAWRSRCSNLRQRGMTIENRQRRPEYARGRATGQVVSEYRYVPAADEWSLS